MKHTLKNQINQSKTSMNHYDLQSIEHNKENRLANKIISSIESKISFVSKLKTSSFENQKKLSQDTQNDNNNNRALKNPKLQGNSQTMIKKPFCRINNILAIYTEDKQEEQPKKPIKSNLDLNQLCNQDIQIGNFRLESFLGQGSYATVRLCIEKNSKVKYAIKIYDKSKINDNQKMNNIKREISILKRINHSNIIKLIYAIEDRKSINLVMEYISNQSLAVYVKSKTKRLLPIQEGLYIFQQLANAIKYLHSKNIAHRDIKMENILLLTDNYVKLIDFGFSICIQDNQKVNVFCGTPSYMSPELVTKVPHNPLCSDIWSLGILLYRMLLGEYPFKGHNDKELYKAIQQNKVKMPNDMNQNITNLIKGCLEKNVNQRFTIEQILCNPLFQQTVNIYALS
ncbi:unnamed protein product (macronuclear) [Paramecium tetraurelia]|uniref:Protein kinase domain-containing protein n=1 Tax=Paramecium tetraurelia TaxID=5888 RepID=A0EEW8_PARTE|nr:uncharacterized protein GSPATT00026182001 [Paramecium tetraurelia]CAK93859.1 unnamed protein product [Paramecium tetraurelia]|eukprot:XP_001461232.1 hypothetical protein (macronuclear) [Paramecium tetraurelia strain d4-2]